MYNKKIEIKGVNNGYQYFIDYDHPLATGNSGRIYYHRHVASIKLGRWLQHDEQAHHIDENKLNNDINNIEVLSELEHRKLHYKKRNNLPDDYEWFESEIIECKWCNTTFETKYKNHLYCSKSCAALSMPELFPIDKEILSELIWKIPSTEIAKIYGCSDRTIGKKCKRYNITKPNRGYWTKQNKSK